MRMDVTEAPGVESGLDAACEALGVPDIVVNLSGIAQPAHTLDVSETDWAAVGGTNFEGAWRVAQETARRMVHAERPGTIINVLSILAFGVARGLGSYAASKAGLLQLTRTMAMEFARHGVRVNAIAPGYVLTEMNREFIASDASSYMTGSTIVVDAGHLASSL